MPRALSLKTDASFSQSNLEVIHRTSHALEHLAGPWCQSIAEHIPFPHSAFLERSSAWMHIFGVILSSPISSNGNIQIVLDHAKDWRDAAFAGSPSFTTDNVCLLKKLALPLWDRGDYRTFTSLLTCCHAVKVMIHEEAITVGFVRILAALPVEFRNAKIVGFLLHEVEGILLKSLFENRTNADRIRLSSALGMSSDRGHFWGKVTEHFFREIDHFPSGPTIADDRFQAVRTFHDLERTGQKYRNCLRNFRNYGMEALAGEIGFLVFKGTETAVISYKPLIGGRWVIDDILGPKNMPVSQEVFEEIRLVLSPYGFVFSETNPGALYQDMETQLSRLAHSTRADRAEQTALAAISKLGSLRRNTIAI
ncbi:hypothetical protein [Maricaulis sp.]|uniref:hypothetical protein n=1 Tax=Maricaulis sp. TaxID=1486257 RepID=UPI003A8CB586